MGNNIVLQPFQGDTLTLTSVANGYHQPSSQYPSFGFSVYTGTITGGASNGLVGQGFTVAGFTNAQNNGTFACIASSATTLTLNNAFAVAESAAATASPLGQGFPIQYASKISNMIANDQGDNVFIEANGGECLVAIAIGLKSLWPFDQLHGSSPSFGFLQGLNDFNANPTISDNATVTPESPFDARLGTAANYALLAAAGITNTGATVITGGNVGSYPTTSITPGAWVLTSPAVIDNTDAQAAQGAALAAYNYFTALTFTSLSGSTANLSALSGGGAPTGHYYPGNYSAGSSMDIPTSITLDAQGNPNATFVFKAGSTVTLESGASVILANGAQPQNVIWLVGSSFTSVATSSMVGTILANTSITLGGGTLSGRAIAGVVTTSGAITISAQNNVTVASIGGAVNTWVLAGHINIVDSDYTPGAYPPGTPTFAEGTTAWPSSKWSIDGYYPSVYVWVAQNVVAGSYSVNLNSVYQNGIVPPLDLAAGKPIFDGGVNFQVIKLSGAASSNAVDAFSIGVTSSNPANAPATLVTTAANGDAIISIGLMKSGNVFSAGSVGEGGVGSPPLPGAGLTAISSGKLVGSEAHYIVEYGLTAAGSAGAYDPNFSNPFEYEMVVGSIAIKSS